MLNTIFLSVQGFINSLSWKPKDFFYFIFKERKKEKKHSVPLPLLAMTSGFTTWKPTKVLKSEISFFWIWLLILLIWHLHLVKMHRALTCLSFPYLAFAYAKCCTFIHSLNLYNALKLLLSYPHLLYIFLL